MPGVRLARLALAVALLGGCSGGDGGPDDTLPPRASTSVSTSTTVDYSVPAVIDVAYVERVMEALDRVYGDAIRLLARDREITKEFLEHLAAIYTPSEFEVAQRAWVQDVASGLRGLRPTPGDPATEVQELIQREGSCIVIAVDRDFSSTRSSPLETPQKYIALVPRATTTESINPTPWSIAFDGFIAEPPGAEPEAPCGH